MPYYFACPRCNERNYGFESAPESLPDGKITFFNDMKCIACGVGGIYWVKTDAAARIVRSNFPSVPLNLIAVGATESPIGWFDPGGRKEIQKDVVELLRPVATLDASFSQGERRRELLPDRVDVAQGLCEGLSLHWIRRVLQGGKTAFTVESKKGNLTRSDAVILARLKRQMSTGANVQVIDVKDEWSDAYLTRLGFTKQGTMWSIPANLKTLWAETQAKGKYAKHWTKLAHEYDSKALNVNGRRSKRPFSNLVALSSTMRKEQALDVFARDLCADRNFGPGSAALLSVGLRVGRGEAGGRISGHAVAAYCRTSSEYYLFDPNIGVFRCSTSSALRRAIEILIGEGWTKKLNWELEETYGYSLFQARRSAATVQPREQPVTISSSPQVTAIENKPLLPASPGPGRGAPSTSPTTQGRRPLAPRPTPSGSPQPSPVVAAGGVKPAVPRPSPGQPFRPQGAPQTVVPSGGVAARRAMFENLGKK